MPLVHEPGIGADEFGEMGQESDDVVLGDALDLVDARDVEFYMARLFPYRPRALLRDDADLGSASQACASISNQMRNRVAGAQTMVISGRE